MQDSEFIAGDDVREPEGLSEPPLAGGVSHPWFGPKSGVQAESSAAVFAGPRKRGRPQKESASTNDRVEGSKCLVTTDGRPVRRLQVPSFRLPISWDLNIPHFADKTYDMVRLALLSENPNARTDTWWKFQDVAFNFDKPRPIMQRGAESMLMRYASGSSSFIREQFTLMGCITYMLARVSWSSVVAHLIRMHDAKKIRIIFDFSMISSDETSMYIGQKKIRNVFKDCVAQTRAQHACTSTNRTEKVLMKITQSELLLGVGIQHLNTGSDMPEFDIILCELPTKLHGADSMTADNTVRIFQDTREDGLFLSGQLHARAQFGCDVSMTDRGANCLAANRKERKLNASRLRFDGVGCMLHNMHLATKVSISPFLPIFSGLTSFSLLQRPAGVEMGLRKCLQQVLRQRARPRVRTQPPDRNHPTMVFRKHVLDCLLGRPQDKSLREAYEWYFKGDIASQFIDVFLADIPEDAVSAALDEWSEGAAAVLYRHKAEIVSTHRWLKSIQPIKEVTLMDATHDVRREALQLFLKISAATTQDTKHNQIVLVDGQPVFLGAHAQEDAEQMTSSALWSALNAKTRMDAKEHARTNAFAEEMLMSIILEPLVKLNGVLFNMDGEEWEAKQFLRGMQHNARAFRLLELHNGNVTRAFWTQTGSLMSGSGSQWQPMPSHLFTMKMRALRFAGISRMQGAIFHYMDEASNGYPHKALRLLDGARDLHATADEMMHDCPQMHPVVLFVSISIQVFSCCSCSNSRPATDLLNFLERVPPN